MSGNALLDAKLLLRSLGVQPGMHVADFGVGRTGHLVFPAAEMVGSGGKVYGVDIQRDALDMLEGRRRQYLVHNLDLVHGDIEAGNLPIPQYSLDLVFFVHTLGQARRHAEILHELDRLVKKDGRVVVVDWLPDAAHPVAPFDTLRLHPRELDSTFVKAGCTVCGEFSPSPWHWGRVYSLD